MSVSERLHEIRTGFERPFWVANISELFERLSYYAAFASLARYLHETLNFRVEQASSLTGLFGGLVWFLAAFGGTLADRLGFRRSLSLAYLILSCSYFLLGSLGASWLAPVRNAMPLGVLVAVGAWNITMSRLGMVSLPTVAVDIATYLCLVLALKTGRLGWWARPRSRRGDRESPAEAGERARRPVHREHPRACAHLAAVRPRHDVPAHPPE